MGKCQKTVAISLKGNHLNAIAHDLFLNDNRFKSRVSLIASVQFHKHPTAFRAVSVFDIEDLEQEMWSAVFNSNENTDIGLELVAKRRAKALEQRGMRKTFRKETHVPFSESPRYSAVPISQLPKVERLAMTDLLYSSTD